MNIVLIQPKTEGYDNFPPLGLGYLATVAVNHGHQVLIVDLEVENYSDEKLLKVVNGFKPLLVGITSTIRSKNEALRLAGLFNDYKVVFGGPQATLEPEVYLGKNERYFVLKGECEIAFLKFIDYLTGLISIDQVTNLVYWKNNQIFQNNPEPIITDLNTLPIVDRKLFNFKLYRSKLYRKKATNMLTSRGCPFRCSFCFHDFHGKFFRQISFENMIKEIMYLKKDFGCEGFIIFDDNFTVDKKRLKDFCDYIITEKIDITWRCLSRVNVVDKDILKLMKQAGCKEIAFGIESSSPETLARINKRISPEQSKQAMDLCRQIGIVSKAYMMIGFPWETKEMILDTIDFACKIMPYSAQFSVLTPLPDTDIYKETIEMGYKIDPDFDFTRFNPCFETENFTKEEIIALQNYAKKKFERSQVIYALKRPVSHFSLYLLERYARSLFYQAKALLKKIIVLVRVKGLILKNG